MVLENGINALVRFFGFQAISVFGFFVLLNLEKVLQHSALGQNVYLSMS